MIENLVKVYRRDDVLQLISMSEKHFAELRDGAQDHMDKILYDSARLAIDSLQQAVVLLQYAEVPEKELKVCTSSKI